VLSQEGRTSRVGTPLTCRLCKAERSGDEPEGRQLSERVRAELIRIALKAYEDAALQGLCAEGAWEVAVAAMRAVDLATILSGHGVPPEPDHSSSGRPNIS
jgi:hypothetical protein